MARAPKPWWREDRQAWFVTIDGKRQNLGSNRKEAAQRFHTLMASPAKVVVTKPTESVAAIIDLFLDWTQKHRASRTYDWYRDRCQWFCKAVPDLQVAQLKPYHVQQWLDSHPNWSDGHRRGCIIAMQRPFRWAAKMGLIDRSPIEHLEKPQAGSREQVISPDEFQKMLSLVRDDQFRDLLVTAWETGARPQELLRVEARHAHVAQSRWVFPKNEAKGKTRVRIVYVANRSLEITERLVKEHPEGPLFRNKRGTPWTPFSVKCRFQRLQEKLGVSYCLYAFRHSFATRMLEAGVDARTVSILMGHSDTSMLGKVYQHLSYNPKLLADQVKRASV